MFISVIFSVTWTLYFRSQKVADEVQIQQISELIGCGVISRFMRRVWREKVQKQQEELRNSIQTTSSPSFLLKGLLKNNVRLTPPCIVDQAVDVSITLHRDCDQPLQRDMSTGCRPERQVTNKRTAPENKAISQMSSSLIQKHPTAVF